MPKGRQLLGVCPPRASKAVPRRIVPRGQPSRFPDSFAPQQSDAVEGGEMYTLIPQCASADEKDSVAAPPDNQLARLSACEPLPVRRNRPFWLRPGHRQYEGSSTPLAFPRLLLRPAFSSFACENSDAEPFQTEHAVSLETSLAFADGALRHLARPDFPVFDACPPKPRRRGGRTVHGLRLACKPAFRRRGQRDCPARRSLPIDSSRGPRISRARPK